MYAGPGDRILDTHLGSGTIAIACYNAGISLTACEISRTYYENAIAKISEYIPADLIELLENECRIRSTNKKRASPTFDPPSQFQRKSGR